jgi:hypothetical protein
MFGSKRDKVTRKWRKIHNEKLNDLYCWQNIIWVIKLRRMRWTGHVARMRTGEVYSFGGKTWGKETTWKT